MRKTAIDKDEQKHPYTAIIEITRAQILKLVVRFLVQSCYYNGRRVEEVLGAGW